MYLKTIQYNVQQKYVEDGHKKLLELLFSPFAFQSFSIFYESP